MKGILFFVVVLAIAVVLWMTWPVAGAAAGAAVANKTEGFQDGSEDTGDKPPAGSAPGLTIPLVSPRQQTLVGGDPKPFAPAMTELLAPPPGQIAEVNSRPAEDPALKKASPMRIKSVSESLSGFFEREAPGLSKLGDPSVQLPLSTARADRARLEDELAVLKRNPGLESTLTEEDVNGIEANLGYLQKKWRLSVNSGVLSPMPGGAVGATEEGFLGFSVEKSKGWFGWFFEGGQEGFTDGPMSVAYTSTQEGFQPSSQISSIGGTCGTGGTGGTARTCGTGAICGTGGICVTAPMSDPKTKKTPATIADLDKLSLQINAEILRLQASGSTSLNTTSRIDKLAAILALVSNEKNAVVSGQKTAKEIAISKEDIAAFLPTMSDLTTPLPNLLAESGLSSVLNNLFPPYAPGDISGAQLSRELMARYGKTLLNNLSWGVNLEYTSEAEKEMAKQLSEAALYGKQAAESDAETAKIYGSLDPGSKKTRDAYRGLFESIIGDLTGGGTSGSSGSGGGGSGSKGKGITASITINDPKSKGSNDEKDSTADYSRTGQPLNWKERATHICSQIDARGMKPGDFGCLADPEGDKYQGFSWRGYAKMVCSRLGTMYDTSIPELCGCPPPTWPGWRA